MSVVIVVIAVEIAITTIALLWLSEGGRGSWTTGLCACLFGLAAASCLDVAIHVVLMKLRGFDGYLPNWLAIIFILFSVAGVAIALRLKPSPWVLVGPCSLVSAASLACGVFYGEPWSGAPSILVLIAALASTYCLREWFRKERCLSYLRHNNAGSQHSIVHRGSRHS